MEIYVYRPALEEQVDAYALQCRNDTEIVARHGCIGCDLFTIRLYDLAAQYPAARVLNKVPPGMDGTALPSETFDDLVAKL